MKLLCWNIGIKIDNTGGILDFLENNEFDIIAFQEALKAHEDKVCKMSRTKNDIEDKFIGTYPHTAFAPVWGAKAIVKNGKLDRDFGGFVEQGSLILSKYEIVEHHNQFYHLEYKEPGFDATYFKRDDHARSIQNALLNINGKKIRIINIHGIWNEGKLGDNRTMHQCQFIVEKALEDDYPTIILGDLNLLPNADSIEIINRKFRNLIIENNIKSTRPTFDDGLDSGDIVCDYIFVDENIIVKELKVFNNRISDHMPLSLDFDIIEK